jgi:two-component system LytT family response regulator
LIRALIVDDEPLARSRVRMLLAAHPDVIVIAEGGSAREAAQVMASETPDVVFLDVDMPQDDGFAVAAAMTGEPIPAVVFVTAHEQFALQAFEANAVDYLVKPFSAERLARAIDRVRRFLGSRTAALQPQFFPASSTPPRRRERFVVRVRGDVLFVKVMAIEWIAAEGNYARLHTAETSYLIRQSLQNLESELDPQLFVRVHRSAIVNIERVRKLILGPDGVSSIILQSEAAVAMGPTYRERLDQMLGQKL